MKKTINTKELEVYNYLRENEQSDVDFINQKLENNPNNQFYKILKARILIKMFKLKKAKKIFIKMEDDLHEEYLKFYLLAKAEFYMMKGKTSKIYKSLDVALKIDPEFVDALELKGHILTSEDRDDEVITLLEKLSIDKTTSFLSFLIGRALYNKKLYEKAEVALFKSLSGTIEPSTFIMLGNIEIETNLKKNSNNIKNANDYFKCGFQLFPNNMDTTKALAQFYIDNQNFESALDSFTLYYENFTDDFTMVVNNPTLIQDHYHKELELLENDLIICSLLLINGEYKLSKSYLENSFYWEYGSVCYYIILNFVDSFLSGNLTKYNNSKLEVQNSISEFYWFSMIARLDEEFYYHNRINSLKTLI